MTIPGHNHFMQQALAQAAKGFPNAFPNPLVGCVIVHKGEVVAQGYHQTFGEAHAEVNAINALPANISPEECTLYVTLEPCSHYGKTPPCADLILEKGFKTVVVANTDPNPIVSGRGLQKLREAGVEVVTGIMEAEAKQLNRRFMTFFGKKRAYIILKWAQTADGFISRVPVPQNRADNHISGPRSNAYVHQLRASVQAIMVGKNTALCDNPRLTTRLVEGKSPVRVLIDPQLKVPIDFNIYNGDAPTLVFNAVKHGIENNVSFVQLDLSGNVPAQVAECLYELGHQTVLVEGGAHLLNSFIKAGLWDEICRIENPGLHFGIGVKAPAISLGEGIESSLDGDRVSVFFNTAKR